MESRPDRGREGNGRILEGRQSRNPTTSDKMEEMLMGIVQKLRSIQVSQEIHDEKENKMLAGFKEWKSKSDSK